LASTEKPLAGKRVVVTRAPEQAQDLVRALERLGAQVLLLPTVAFAPLEDWRKLDEELQRLDWFDAVLFLSRNAVRYIFDRCAQLGIKLEMLQSPKRVIAAVGPGTADEITARGLQVDYMSKGRTGDALVRELRQSLKGRKVLLPRSDRGDDSLLDSLQEAGAEVTSVIAYRTAAPETLDPKILARIRGWEVDVIAFASPSAFRNLSTAMGSNSDIAGLSSHIRFAAIGPTTARVMREAGVPVEIEASEASAAGLADALAKYFESRAAATTTRLP
jgi:uroporphyrinogen-III synthase